MSSVVLLIGGGWFVTQPINDSRIMLLKLHSENFRVANDKDTLYDR
ncbi:hypothetical protein QWZ13_09210 [Reinekea marina]|nr:hypothetical protein [Reinekea marina]MDN3649086.1 hypothetical protein [Reinekea marina]